MNENYNILVVSFSAKTRVVEVKQRNEGIKEDLFLSSPISQGCHINTMKMRKEKLEGREGRNKILARQKV